MIESKIKNLKEVVANFIDEGFYNEDCEWTKESVLDVIERMSGYEKIAKFRKLLEQEIELSIEFPRELRKDLLKKLDKIVGE